MRLVQTQIGNMHEAVDAFFNLDESAKVSELADPAFYHTADRVALVHGRPGVGFELLDAERNAALRRLHFQHDAFDIVSDFHYFGRVLHAPRPGHLGDVNQILRRRLPIRGKRRSL